LKRHCYRSNKESSVAHRGNPVFSIIHFSHRLTGDEGATHSIQNPAFKLTVKASNGDFRGPPLKSGM
jgi:hypothetical protein